MTRGWGGLENEKGVSKAILLGQMLVREEQRLVSGSEKNMSSMLGRIFSGPSLAIMPRRPNMQR